MKRRIAKKIWDGPSCCYNEQQLALADRVWERFCRRHPYVAPICEDDAGVYSNWHYWRRERNAELRIWRGNRRGFEDWRREQAARKPKAIAALRLPTGETVECAEWINWPVFGSSGTPTPTFEVDKIEHGE